MLPTTQFAYWKIWVPVMHFCASHIHYSLQNALESGQEARMVQIYFSTAFNRVNHMGILYKRCSVGVGGSVLSILTEFLSNRSQYVMVNGSRGELVKACQECRGACFSPVIVPPVHFRAFFLSWE